MCQDNNCRSFSGLSKKNNEAHSHDHQMWSRRDFVKSLGLTTTMGMFLGTMPISVIPSAGNNFTGDTDNILIIIRLVGGNDALNMIVPLYDYGTYQSLRPTIAHKRSSLINLSDEIAIPETASSFMPMWNSGKMKVIHGAGYPDQNLSHFRSTDIWATAEPEEENTQGWLGELITLYDPDIVMHPPEHPAAIQIGNSGNLTFNNGSNTNLSFNVSNTDQLFQFAENGNLYPVENLSDCLHGQQLEYARTIANSTFRYADVVKEAYEASTNSVNYLKSQLADQLALVARLIKGGLQSSFYLVNLNGFDTHANEAELHNGLMEVLSANVTQFYDDLASTNDDKRVLTMTSSEFGRRPQQNASGGTDHGAAAAMLLFGPALNGNGFIGEHPSLQDLDQVGNLKYSNDFRHIYSSIMVNWLCFPESVMQDVLETSFNPLDLGFSCSSSRTMHVLSEVDNMKLLTRSGRIYTLELSVNTELYCSVLVYDNMGKLIADLHKGTLFRGKHPFEFRASENFAGPGMYYFVVRGKNGVKSIKFMVM